ncbi:MAG: hypothetical protein SO129_05005 [Anaerovibrio sp.]|nr:hypothetical protein [Anaerovibrio sp.]
MGEKIDVAFWPSEGAEGLAIFQKLRDKMDRAAFDDEFLALLEQYRQLYPDSEHVDIFAAKFAFAYGDYQAALDLSLPAFR